MKNDCKRFIQKHGNRILIGGTVLSAAVGFLLTYLVLVILPGNDLEVIDYAFTVGGFLGSIAYVGIALWEIRNTNQTWY